MLSMMNRLLDVASDYFASRKGLLPLIGIALVIIDLILQFFPILGWVTSSNVFMHVGIIVAIIGIMLAWAL